MSFLIYLAGYLTLIAALASAAVAVGAPPLQTMIAAIVLLGTSIVLAVISTGRRQSIVVNGPGHARITVVED